MKEKVYEVLLFVLIFMAILSIIILTPLDSIDELWNYNFARNISQGLIPYKDFNMVVTPLLSMICGIVLKIICNELIIMRILAAILCALIVYITYKLFNLLNVKKEFCIILTFAIGYLFRDLFCIDYNYATLLIALVIIYREIKLYIKDNKLIKVDFKEDMFLGIIAGLAITVKQTSGIFLAVALLGNKLLLLRKKEEFKVFAKSFLYRLIGILIPVIGFVAYLIFNNAFDDFINYAILGIEEFSNQTSYIKLIRFNVIGVLRVLVPITFLYIWIKNVIFEKFNTEYFFMIYGLATFVICFPISDGIHFLIGSLPIIIIIFYYTYKCMMCLVNKIFKKSTRVWNVSSVFKYIVIIFLIFYSTLNLYKYFKGADNFSKLKHFKFIPVTENLEKLQEEVCDYIEEKEDVKILDALAVFFMIPADKYNKDYDMFNKGNFGINGEERIIEEISNSNTTKYLIVKERYNENWQMPWDIINYVRNNKTKVGEIGMFEIYE